ncbi:MAG: quinolinate synthase [Phycisphaerales bacterium]
MLWQPSLPDSYTGAAPADLAQRISRRRQELGQSLLILGHHYQTDEIIQHADFTGDSLKLSQLAAQRVAELGAKYVVFCGVHFMAETADMLTPDGVAVILPDLSAGCSMADMADYDDAVAAWDAMHASLHAQGWNGRIIPITYINSSAAIKAFVGMNGGAVCTSSNAAAVMQWALAGGISPHHTPSAPEQSAPRKPKRHVPPHHDIKILFLPDQHLGRNTAAARGMDVATQTCLYDPRRAARGEDLGGIAPQSLLAASVILWAGHCSVHKLFRPEHCAEIDELNRGKRGKDRTRILVHPECCKDVVDRSDLAGSTEFIIKSIREAEPGSHWAVGTEVHLVSRLACEAAQRGVHVRILSDCQCLCTTMFRIDQPHLCWVLDHLAAGKVVNRISVNAKARQNALLALERMMSLAPATPTAVAGPVD